VANIKQYKRAHKQKTYTRSITQLCSSYEWRDFATAVSFRLALRIDCLTFVTCRRFSGAAARASFRRRIMIVVIVVSIIVSSNMTIIIISVVVAIIIGFW
jgi:hypothetical protein